MIGRRNYLPVAAALALAAGAAVANPGDLLFEGWVEGTGEPIDAVFVLVDESPCGFPVYVDYRYYEIAKLFYDGNGAPSELRFWDRQGRFAYYTDAELSSVRLEEKNSVLVGQYLFNEDLIIVRGNGQHLVLPKLGNVFRQTGYWAIDLVAEELTIQHGNQRTHGRTATGRVSATRCLPMTRSFDSIDRAACGDRIALPAAGWLSVELQTLAARRG